MLAFLVLKLSGELTRHCYQWNGIWGTLWGDIKNIFEEGFQLFGFAEWSHDSPRGHFFQIDRKQNHMNRNFQNLRQRKHLICKNNLEIWKKCAGNSLLRLASAYRSAPCIYYPGSCTCCSSIIIIIIYNIITIIYNIIIIIILCATYIVKVLNITLAFLLEILHPVKNNISRYLDYSSQYISPCLYTQWVLPTCCIACIPKQGRHAAN